MVTFHRDSCRHCLEAKKRHSSEQLYLPHPQAPTPHFRSGEKPWSFSIFIEQFWIHQKWSLARVLQQPEGHRKALSGIIHLLSIHPLTSISDPWPSTHTADLNQPGIRMCSHMCTKQGRNSTARALRRCQEHRDRAGMLLSSLLCSTQHQPVVGLTQNYGLGRGDWKNLTLFIVNIIWEMATEYLLKNHRGTVYIQQSGLWLIFNTMYK